MKNKLINEKRSSGSAVNKVSTVDMNSIVYIVSNVCIFHPRALFSLDFYDFCMYIRSEPYSQTLQTFQQNLLTNL